MTSDERPSSRPVVPIPRHFLRRARDLRKQQTPPEDLLWMCLRNRSVHGLKFLRQHGIGPFVVDFACLERRLVVEVDGVDHDQSPLKDKERAAWLEGQGWRVVRVLNEDVRRELDAVVAFIAGEVLRVGRK